MILIFWIQYFHISDILKKDDHCVILSIGRGPGPLKAGFIPGAPSRTLRHPAEVCANARHTCSDKIKEGITKMNHWRYA
jgi:hypothetical protein